MKNSKFYTKKPLKQRLKNFFQSLLFWRGRKKGMIYTKDISLKEIWLVFFPKDFYDKYHYLGSIPYKPESIYFKAIYPLVLAMDYEAKPKWCPRWFLRFLYLFGCDNSLVRVRNRSLHDLFTRLTKGIMMWDYKTKWSDYDLRISIHGPEHLQELADGIEHTFYTNGRQKELVSKIKLLDPNARIVWGSISRLEKQLEDLREQKQSPTLKNKEDDNTIV